MINPNPSKLEDILNSSVQFVVPKYQRHYTWGKAEALDYLEDLKSYAESKDARLFLGTIIFDISEEKEKKVRVVDGQQRLTTTLLLLIACRNVAKRINAHGLAALIQNKITFIDPTTAESLGSRLVASDSIRDVFEEISKSNWDGTFPTKKKRQVNRIKPIYDFFLGEIADYDQKALSGFLRAIYESYVVRIDIQDELEAFSIFERTNARGVDLEASDLLKNYLFASGVEGLDDAWEQIQENSDGTILRMLKYFYVAKKGYVAKADLYKKLRAYGQEVKAQGLVGELVDFSRFYSAIRTEDCAGVRSFLESIGCIAVASDQDKYEKIFLAVEGLRLFKVFQTYPLIYAALGCLLRSKGGERPDMGKKLVELFEALEKYHFVNNAICERIGNEVEKLYAAFSLTFAKSSNFVESTNALIAALRKQLASKEEFISRFADLSYAPDTIPLITYIFDRVNNEGRRPGQRVGIFNSDPKVRRKNHNIEHFYPQKPEAGKAALKGEEIDSIGNLLAISFQTNSSLGNLLPQQKLERLEGDLGKQVDNLQYVREFMRRYGPVAAQWDGKVIQSRALEMAEHAYATVWRIN